MLVAAKECERARSSNARIFFGRSPSIERLQTKKCGSRFEMRHRRCGKQTFAAARHAAVVAVAPQGGRLMRDGNVPLVCSRARAPSQSAVDSSLVNRGAHFGRSTGDGGGGEATDGWLYAAHARSRTARDPLDCSLVQLHCSLPARERARASERRKRPTTHSRPLRVG